MASSARPDDRASPAADVLLVAATARELPPADGWATLVCGVGPVEAAVVTAAALARQRPRVLVHIGIAGARARAGLAVPSLVIGRGARYEDAAPDSRWVERELMTDESLVRAAQGALPQAACCVIGTSARVGGGGTADVEAMEGFAVLRAARQAGVPALELRAISNLVEEADRGAWRVEEAIARLHAALPAVVREVSACVR